MTSPKLLLALMATVAVHAAPQINEREVVGEVIQSLGPAIQQALASLGSSSSSSSSSSFGSSPIVGRVSSTSSASRPQTSRRNTFVSAPTGVTRSASGPSVSSVTSSVVSQLQPSIAAAVAEALKASSRPVSRQVYKPVEEPNYGPAKYNFGYKVADEESQAYINHQESREGNDVTGMYNYVNPAGALVTVNYEAGIDGFSQTRDVKQGAVQMRNIPGAWTGPLAGVDEIPQTQERATTISNNRARVSTSSSQVSQEALIAQILSSIQPQISSAVQGALSSSTQTAGRRTVAVAAPRPQVVRVAAPRPIAPRPRPGVIAPSRRAQASSSRGNLGEVFGNGETSVKFATPQFQFEF